MSKTSFRELTKTIQQKRQQLVTIREEVEGLLDYLEVLEARARDAKKPRLMQAGAKNRINLKCRLIQPSTVPANANMGWGDPR